MVGSVHVARQAQYMVHFELRLRLRLGLRLWLRLRLRLGGGGDQLSKNHTRQEGLGLGLGLGLGSAMGLGLELGLASLLQVWAIVNATQGVSLAFLLPLTWVWPVLKLNGNRAATLTLTWV